MRRQPTRSAGCSHAPASCTWSRDGRDVAASVARRPWGPNDVASALVWWADNLIEIHRSIERADPARVRTIRLEAHVGPESERHALCRAGRLLGSRPGPWDACVLRPRALTSEAQSLGLVARRVGRGAAEPNRRAVRAGGRAPGSARRCSSAGRIARRVLRSRAEASVKKKEHPRDSCRQRARPRPATCRPGGQADVATTSPVARRDCRLAQLDDEVAGNSSSCSSAGCGAGAVVTARSRDLGSDRARVVSSTRRWYTQPGRRRRRWGVGSDPLPHYTSRTEQLPGSRPTPSLHRVVVLGAGWCDHPVAGHGGRSRMPPWSTT